MLGFILLLGALNLEETSRARIRNPTYPKTGLDLRSESTPIDNRYQTTIPDAVRSALGLSKRDKIRYVINSNGVVTISRVDLTGCDPVLSKFLSFLAQDMSDNPQQIQSIDPNLVQRIQSLVVDVEIDRG
jgi:antitoxin PrlF